MFTHLHVHSGYSILDGACRIPELIKEAKNLGMTSLALTDHGVMHGAIEFYKECENQGIKPIIGSEIYTCKDMNIKSQDIFHLVLLAKDLTGYENLCKIVSEGYTNGFYYKPRVDKNVLRKYSEGLIALSGCVSGEIAIHFLKNEDNEALNAALELKEIFGDDFYLEIQRHGLSKEEKAYSKIIALSKETGIPLVCTNDVHYVKPEDYIVQDILVCIKQNKKLNDTNRMSLNDACYYLKSETEMRSLYPELKEAFDNTNIISDKCNLKIPFHKTKMPRFDIPKGMSAKDYLYSLCIDGIKKRYSDFDTYIPRMEYELDVINKMGFNEYFLIVWDFINWSKNNGITVGPGRGSCCGSIVAYCLGISDIDPIKYDLLFERFLNPERVSMPDIDTDFEFERRGEALEYVKRRYGEDSVVQISTFNTFAAKQAVKDVGRVLNYPFEKTNEITKNMPDNTTLGEIIENPSLMPLYRDETELISLAQKIEGLPKSVGTHAAGVIICPAAAQNYLPLNLNADKTALASQYTMTEIEELGLLKMDFLGLRTLSVIKNTERFTDTNVNKIDYCDKEVFKLISSGKTSGVFQLESNGMQEFMQKLKPNSIEDLIAGIALYRPGPMDFIPQFIRGKNGNAEYICSELKPILSNTYGCIVYQEQVMQIFQDLAGYSLGQADNIRRAMSKKKQKVIDEERNTFINGDKTRNIDGCIKRGIKKQHADKIYDSMTDFAKYAFNKSHAAAYAVVSYQTAYLKTYYPKEYYAALLTSVIGNNEKLHLYYQALKKDKLNLLPPSVYNQDTGFIPTKNGIIFALDAITQISTDSAKTILNEAKKGEYNNFNDFIERNKTVLDKEKLSNLIKSGSLDEIPGNRHQKILVGSGILENAIKEERNQISGQLSLFDISEEIRNDYYPDVEEYDNDVLYDYETESCGIYISGHPLKDYEELINMFPETDYVCGIITEIKTVFTKKRNEEMCFFKITGIKGEYEFVAFPSEYRFYRKCFELNNKVVIKYDAKNDGDSLIVKRINQFKDFPRRLWIKVKNETEYNEKWLKLLSIKTRYPGMNACFVINNETKQFVVIPAFSNLNNIAIKELKNIFGDKNIAVTYEKIVECEIF